MPTQTPPADHAAPRPVDDVGEVLERAADDLLTSGPRLAAARSAWLSPSLARTLTLEDHTPTRLRLAENTRTPADVLTQLLDDTGPNVGAAALSNPSTPFEHVHARAGFDVQVRHPHCPPDLLRAALADVATISSPASIDPTLGTGFTAGYGFGSGAQTQHRRLRTLETAAVALAHPNLPVEDAVAWLAATTTYMRGQLSADLLAHPEVTHGRAVSVLRTLDASARQRGLSVWRQHPNASPGWLTSNARIAGRGRRGIAPTWQQAQARRELASNANAPVAVLEILGRHAPLLPELLAHRNVTPTLHHTALSYPARQPEQFGAVCAVIAANPSAHAGVLARIPAATIIGEQRLAFVSAWATAREQASVLVALLPTWTGSVLDALRCTDAVTA